MREAEKPHREVEVRSIGRTAIILGALFVADLGFAGQGLLSIFAALIGMTLLVVGSIWAAVRGRGALARTRIALAGIYLALGVASYTTVRVHAFTAETHAAQIIEACGAYKAKHGSFPNTLQELVPEFLPSIPRAKYVYAWGTYSYWRSSPTSHTLMYTAVAPFGRRLYDLESGRWSVID